MAESNVPAIMPVIMAPDDAGVAAAVAHLRAGRHVTLPTETVYGLAARADQDDAVAAIYRAKGRPDFNPLIVHIRDAASAACLAEFDERARALAAAFWPGPLTLVLPRRPDAPLAAAVTAGLATVALRAPAHPVMRRVLGESGLALAAPSANRSGAVSPTCAAHVAASLGARAGLILDGGPCGMGVESTIVALRAKGWQMLRPGPVSAIDIANVLEDGGLEDRGLEDRGAAPIEAPGQLASHYAPGKPVRLGVLRADPDEFLIGFGPVKGDVTLSPSGDLAQAAAHLYAALHRAAAAAHPRIAVAPVPAQGIGIAINDRLRRASAAPEPHQAAPASDAPTAHGWRQDPPARARRSL